MDSSEKENTNKELISVKEKLPEHPFKRLKIVPFLSTVPLKPVHPKYILSKTQNYVKKPPYFSNLTRQFCKICKDRVYECKCKLVIRNGKKIRYQVFRRPGEVVEKKPIETKYVNVVVNEPGTSNENCNQSLESICQLHQKYCEYTEEKRRGLGKREFEFTFDKKFDNSHNRIVAWKFYSTELERDIESTGRFIQYLDNKLEAPDRATLLKKHAFEANLLKMTRALSFNGLHLPDGRLIDFPTFTLLYGYKLANAMVNFAKQLVEWNLTDDDIAMLILLVFHHPMKEKSPLEESFENPKHVTEVFLEYKQKFYSRYSYRQETQTFLKIIRLFPKIHQMNKLHEEIRVYLGKHHEYFCDDSLFKEIYVKMPVKETKTGRELRGVPKEPTDDAIIVLD